VKRNPRRSDTGAGEAADDAPNRQPSPDLPYITPSLRPLAVDVAGLVEDPRNPRVHSEHNLRAIEMSLGQFRQVSPIKLAADGKTVIAGNATLAAARRLGWSKIAAVVTHLPADSLYRVADNRTTDLSSFDERSLAGILEDAKGGEEEIESSGFTDGEIEAMIHRANRGEGENWRRPDQPEVELSAELHERQDYVLILIDNEMDWSVICDALGVGTVMGQKIPRMEHQTRGTGRVVPASRVLELIARARQAPEVT